MNVIRENPYDSPHESPPPNGTSLLRVIGSIILVVLGTVCLCVVLMIGPFTWLLRDGLGPDSTTSVGWSALKRTFWCFYWGPATLLSSLIFLFAFSLRHRFTVWMYE